MGVFCLHGFAIYVLEDGGITPSSLCNTSHVERSSDLYNSILTGRLFHLELFSLPDSTQVDSGWNSKTAVNLQEAVI